MSAAGQLGFDFIEMSIDETQERQLRLEWSKAQRREFAAWSRQELCVSSICLSAHRKYPIGAISRKSARRGCRLWRTRLRLAYDLGIRIIQLADMTFITTRPPIRKQKNILRKIFFALPEWPPPAASFWAWKQWKMIL